MKSAIVLFTLLIVSPMSWATKNLNSASCIYFYYGTGWKYYGYQIHDIKYDLPMGETRELVSAWSDHPRLQNHVVCSTMIGTDSDDAVEIKYDIYLASQISRIDSGCSVVGKDVQLLSSNTSSVSRGNFSEAESDWLSSPSPEKIKIKTYIPMVQEVDNLSRTADAKCKALTP
jgi:hypothetical protein